MFGRKLLLAILAVFAIVSANAREINVSGLITVKGTKEVGDGASIINADTQEFVGIAGEDGRYNITVDSEAELIFVYMSTEEHREKVNGRHIINVKLVPQTTFLDEVSVVAKASKPGLMIDPTDLIVEGNWVKIKPQPIKWPPRLLNSEKRLIVQPIIYNVTRKHASYLTPIVIDGWRYAVTQERMYDWDTSLDSLTAFQVIKKGSSLKDKSIHLVDSLYLENPNDDLIGIVQTTIETYNKIVYGDTLEIAKGTKNPLRFLNYSIAPVSLKEERFIPTPEVELRDTKGEMNLVFPVGKSNLDLSLGNNASEFNALIEEFKRIERSRDMSLRGFEINGYASPEGTLSKNKLLAQERMNSAMATIKSSVDPSLYRDAEMSSHANVASWTEVVSMMRADGLNEEADLVQGILDRYSNPDARSINITKLPFYREIILEKYLPKLRRVNYHIMTTVYRPLNDEEIEELYKKNPKELSKYQYYRYYSSKQGDEREKALRQALETHPDFIAAATDLSEILINRGEDAMGFLEPFFEDPKRWSKLPLSLKLNMGIASMKAMKFTQADEVLSELPDNSETHKAKIYSAAQNGRYKEVEDEISKDSPLNGVLVLLKSEKDSEAWEKAQNLGDSAVELYVKAIASNRLDKYEEAKDLLNQAIELDPSLRDIAKIDSDVLDLLEEDEADTTNTNEE